MTTTLLVNAVQDGPAASRGGALCFLCGAPSVFFWVYHHPGLNDRLVARLGGAPGCTFFRFYGACAECARTARTTIVEAVELEAFALAGVPVPGAAVQS